MPKTLKKINTKLGQKKKTKSTKKYSTHKGGDNNIFVSNDITYINNIDMLKNNDFPKFTYDGGDGFRTLTISLLPNSNRSNNHIQKSIYAEGGAMNYMTNDVTLVATAKNGIFSSLYRGFSGSTLLLSSIVNEGTRDGVVSLASPNPGDIGCFYIPPGKILNIVSSSYIASTNNLKVSTNAKLGGVITGYGLFYTSIESTNNSPGLVWISSYGKLTKITLKPNDKINVDNGVILAFDSSIQFSTHLAGKGLLSSFFSDEGLVSQFYNNTNSDMTIYLQGKSIQSYNDYIAKIASRVVGNGKKGVNISSFIAPAFNSY